MSLGGGTGYEGRDLESQAVDRATAEGITVVVSAGNDGPASQTIGTPSGAQTAISVGAALTPEHTRVFWDFNFGFVGTSNLLFTPTENQMVYFSSRGPTSDMDMIVAWFDTEGILYYEFGGATFSSPEMVKIDATNIDSVYVLVDGFETYGMVEEWEINIWYLN